MRTSDDLDNISTKEEKKTLIIFFTASPLHIAKEGGGGDLENIDSLKRLHLNHPQTMCVSADCLLRKKSTVEVFNILANWLQNVYKMCGKRCVNALRAPHPPRALLRPRNICVWTSCPNIYQR